MAVAVLWSKYHLYVYALTRVQNGQDFGCDAVALVLSVLTAIWMLLKVLLQYSHLKSSKPSSCIQVEFIYLTDAWAKKKKH